MNNSPIFTSSISSALMRQTLMRGFLLGFLGALILLIAGSFLPSSLLHEWGWALFLIAIGLITIGLLPYRRLSKLQLNPDKLILTEDNHIIYFQGKIKFLTLPVHSIASIGEVSYPQTYGIAVRLKRPPIEPIQVHVPPCEVKKMHKGAMKYGNGDLFFPYFTKHTSMELGELLHKLGTSHKIEE